MWGLLAATLLSSQGVWERNYECWESETGAPCWAGVRALYAAEPIEQLQRRGVQVRRIYFLDNHGRIARDGRGHDAQAGMISIERAANGISRLTFYIARRSGLVGTPVVVDVQATDWARVIAATEGMPEASPAGWDGCLHGWEFLIEAADSDAGQLGQVRRFRQGSCNGGPALSFADLVVGLAIDALGRCGATPPGDDRWYQIEWLHRCSLRRRGNSS